MTCLAVIDEAVRLGVFPLERGGTIEPCTVGLRQIGSPDAPAILVLGGISATRRVASAPGETVAGWWDPVVRASRVLSGEVRLLGADFLAGDGLSSTPHPSQGVTTRDQAEAIADACAAVGIASIDAVIGASYGGMVALALAERRPEFVRRVIAISAADQSHPMASAARWIQREIVGLGEAAGRPALGVALARALAMTTYRTAEEFHDRFGAGEAGARSVASYLKHRGEAFAARFGSTRFRVLSESLDRHTVDPARITAPVTLVGVPGDALVPLWQLESLRSRLGSDQPVRRLESRYGHDAFLKEPAALARILDSVLTPIEVP